MELRSFACWLGFCASLLVPGGPLARDQTSPEVRDWLSAVITKIGKADHEQANRSRGKTSGTVTVRVQVAADGFVNRVEVERSSGSPDLDQRARSVVRAASSLQSATGSAVDRGGHDRAQLPSSARP